MKIARKLLFSLGILFFAACMGAVLLFDWSVTGWKAYSVPTGSMRPAIRPGSLVLVHNVPVSSLKNGDVITYANIQKPGATITHRIVKTYKLDGKIPVFVTKGDANPTPDRPIVGGMVKGKEVFHLPYLGSMLSWGKGIIGLIILVYIPAIIIMIEEVRRLSDYYRKMRPYESPGFHTAIELPKGLMNKMATSAKLIPVFIIIAMAISVPVQALLKSNTVSLVNNRITVAKIKKCTGNSTTVTVNGSSGSNTNNVNVNNSSSQTASTGNASSTGNTNGGNATSGNASNTNNTCINITITNH